MHDWIVAVGVRQGDSPPTGRDDFARIESSPKARAAGDRDWNRVRAGLRAINRCCPNEIHRISLQIVRVEGNAEKWRCTDLGIDDLHSFAVSRRIPEDAGAVRPDKIAKLVTTDDINP